jgi:hypothetical protein
MLKNISLLLIALLSLVSCKDEAVDYSVKRPAALSLPEIKKDGKDDVDSTSLMKSISLEEAVSRSAEVFEGNVLSIDSNNYQGNNAMPVYLFNIKVKKRWKGNFVEETAVSFMSRSLNVADVNQENIFFLMPVDSANLFASGNKLHWQWASNAPQNIKVNDSIKTLLTAALAKEP